MVAERNSSRPLWILAGLLLVLSCTRMPTAPRREVVVHGTIVGPAGEAIPRLPLYFFPRDPVLPQSDEPLLARTDISGRYSIPLIPGTYALRMPAAHTGWLGYSGVVTFTPEHRTFDYAFHGVAVSGRLIDPEGLPVEGAVEVTLESPNPSSGYTHTEAGTFAFLLPPGTYSFECTSFRGYDALAATTVSSVPISADTTLDLHFVGEPVQGTVLGMDGLPLPNATVDAFPTQTYTDASGHYRLFTPAGVHAMRCFSPQPGVLPRLVTLAVNGPTTVNFDFRGNLQWSGRVLIRETLEPFAGCYVVADVHGVDNRRATFRADGNGAFQLYLERNLAYDLEVFTDLFLDPPPVYSSVFRATADTTFTISASLPPVP